MKKVHQSEQQKRHRAKRARRELKKRRNPPRGGGGSGQYEPRRLSEDEWTDREAKKYGPTRTVTAPDDFSFIHNTEAVSSFYNDLRQKSTLNKGLVLFVDLRGVTSATLDAFTALTCIVSDLHHEHGTSFQLGRSKSPEVKRFVKKSGFDRLLKGAPSLNRGATSGSFARRYSNRVETREADKAIEFVADLLFRDRRRASANGLPRWVGRKKRAAYRTLVECMSNTKGHASKRGGQHEDWWLSVYHDQERGVAEFCFVDNGIGILKSGNVTRYQRATAAFAGRSPALLQKALDGEIPSQTRQKGRGEGLPAMQADCCDHRLLDNLTIITNDARIDVADRTHTTLRNGFSGTFIHWELSDTEVDR